MERNPLTSSLAIGLLPSGETAFGAPRGPSRSVPFDAGSAGALDCVHLRLELQWPLALFLDQVIMGAGTWLSARQHSLGSLPLDAFKNNTRVKTCIGA